MSKDKVYFPESQIVVDWQNWPMKQRHDVQSITFIFIRHYGSALQIVFGDLFDVDRVLPSKTHTKNSGRYKKVFFFEGHRGLPEW